MTIKDEKLEAVLRSKPATTVRIGINSPPPPIPPALDIEDAKKQKIPATKTGDPGFNAVSWDFRPWLLHW